MKAQELNMTAAKKRKRTTHSKDKHENPMRFSILSGACFSPTQKKSKERDAPSIAHYA